MASLGIALAKNSIKETIANTKNKLSGKDAPKVEWEDFNWPPCLKVMHFKLDELDEFPDTKIFVRNLWISHLIMFLITILNIICNIIQGAVLSGEGLRIMYTFVYFILFNPAQCYFFYTGYKGIIDEPGLLRRAKLLGGVITLAYLLFSIFHFCNFDGWIRIGQLFGKLNLAGAGILALVENIMLTLLIILNSFLLYKINLYQQGGASDEEAKK